MSARRTILPLLVMAFALSQVQATCVYSPPPILSHGQGADTLGAGRMAVGAEGGWGALGSWWNASNVGDPEVTTKPVGAARLRAAVGDNVDVGLVSGIGPQRSFILGPELKWRFARFAPDARPGGPSFNAGLISGIGVGTAEYPYESMSAPRHVFIAPYTGVLASGGVEVVQMFTGLRVAASETLGNNVRDLTIYPVLAFGVQLRPTRAVTFFLEGDLAGGITTHDINDTAVIVYPSLGLSVAFDRPGATPRAVEPTPGPVQP